MHYTKYNIVLLKQFLSLG